MVVGVLLVSLQLAREGVPIILTGDDERDGGREGLNTRLRELTGNKTLWDTFCRRCFSLFCGTCDLGSFQSSYINNKWNNHFFKMKEGYRDGLKHQKGINKGSLHSKVAQSYMTPSLIYSFTISFCAHLVHH